MSSNDTAYLDLLEEVLEHGDPRPSRVGPTRSLFGSQLVLRPVHASFPIISSRRIWLTPILGELECFLKGTRRLSDFKEAGCGYWVENAESWAPGKNDVGRIYGVQWRHWRTQDGEVDQLVNLVEGIRNDPAGRRHLLTAWNPGELDEMCLPPCHILAQFYVSDDCLECIVTMRSVDVCLGLPADMVLYGALLHLVAQEVGLKPGRLIFHLGDTHVYENHVDQAQVQLSRMLTPSGPSFYTVPGNGLFNFKAEKCGLDGYAPDSPLSYVLNV